MENETETVVILSFTGPHLTASLEAPLKTSSKLRIKATYGNF